MSHLTKEFAMKDLGPLSYFLGIVVARTAGGLFLSQRNMLKKFLRESVCRIVNLVSLLLIRKASSVQLLANLIMILPNIAASLEPFNIYLTFTRPNISYVVQQVCLHMHAPTITHMDALKRTLRYIKGTASYGLHLYKSKLTSLISYTDAAWGGCPDT